MLIGELERLSGLKRDAIGDYEAPDSFVFFARWQGDSFTCRPRADLLRTL